jgi:hypothetical protein
MARLLIAIDDGLAGEHAERAASMAGSLRIANEVLVSRHPDDWNEEEVWGGIVLAGPHDRDQLERLKRHGRPSIYCPLLGPCRSGGGADDPGFVGNARAMKPGGVPGRDALELAGALRADSFVQAQCAQRRHGMTTPWVVLPPLPQAAGRRAALDRAAGSVRRLLIVGGGGEGSVEAAVRWCDARSVAPHCLS